MTAEQALARLRRMVAYNVEPVLDEAALADLVVISQVADRQGYAPADDNWTPTYDLNRGAAEGWRWKAAAAAAHFDFKADGAEFSREQVQQHCLEMASRYAAKIVGTVQMKGATALSPWSEQYGPDLPGTMLDELTREIDELGLATAGSAPD